MEHIVQTVEMNFSRISKIAQDMLDSPDDPQSRIESVRRLYKTHIEEFIPEMQRIDRFLRDNVVFFSDSAVPY